MYTHRCVYIYIYIYIERYIYIYTYIYIYVLPRRRRSAACGGRRRRPWRAPFGPHRETPTPAIISNTLKLDILLKYKHLQICTKSSQGPNNRACLGGTTCLTLLV